MKNKPFTKVRKDSNGNINICLRRARVNSGVTLRNLSELTGISIGMLYAYETLRRYPNIERQRKIAEALETSPKELFPDTIPELTRYLRRIEAEPSGNHTHLDFIDALDNLDLGTRVESLEESHYYDPREAENEKESRQYRLKLIIDAIQSLPEKYRQVIEMRYFNGSLSFKAMGDRLGMRKQGADQKVKRALKKLKEIVFNEDGKHDQNGK